MTGLSGAAIRATRSGRDGGQGGAVHVPDVSAGGEAVICAPQDDGGHLRVGPCGLEGGPARERASRSADLMGRSVGRFGPGLAQAAVRPWEAFRWRETHPPEPVD